MTWRAEADNAQDYGRKTEKTVNVNETSYAVIAAIPTRLQTWIRSSVLVVFLSLLEIYLTSRLKIVSLNNGTVYKQKSHSDDFSALSEVAGAHAWPRGQDLHLWPPEVFLLWSSRSITTPWRNVFRSAHDTCKTTSCKEFCKISNKQIQTFPMPSVPCDDFLQQEIHEKMSSFGESMREDVSWRFFQFFQFFIGFPW